MGRMSIVLVLGFAVTLGIMTRAITGRLSDAFSNSSTSYNETRAKNIASSGAEIYVRRVKAGDDSTGTFQISSIMGGSDSISITRINKVVGAKPDTFKLVSVGKFGTGWE